MSNHLKVILLVLGLIAGFAISAQFVTKGVTSPDPYEPFYDLSDSIQLLSNTQDSLQEEVGELREQIDTYEEIAATPSHLETLDKLKEEVGLTEMQGDGIVITLDDAVMAQIEETEVPDEICYGADLRDIVNVLRVAKADAIAINQQRIIYSTSIVCIGSSVMINNIRMLPPFNISALTDEPQILKTYLETEKFLPTLIQRKNNNQIVFEIEMKEKLKMPIYKGNLETNYIQ